MTQLIRFFCRLKSLNNESRPQAFIGTLPLSLSPNPSPSQNNIAITAGAMAKTVRRETRLHISLSSKIQTRVLVQVTVHGVVAETASKASSLQIYR